MTSDTLLAPIPVPAPFGSWPSPLPADRIASATIRLGGLAVDGQDVFWLEGRPQEGGRQVLIRRDASGRLHEPVAAPFNVRSRVHEYGGGAYLVLPDRIVFTSFADQQLWQVARDGRAAPERLTDLPGVRFADARHDPANRRLIAVREDHRGGGANPPAALVAIALDGDEGAAVGILVEGRDFVASPAASPDGRQLAWLAWDHPSMPWDAAELWLADIAPDGTLRDLRRIAGGPGESIFHPQWSPAGVLHAVSDRSGWWNLHRLADDGRGLEPLYPSASEFGLPQWVAGQSTYGFDGERIVCCHREGGRWRLAQLDPANGAFGRIETPYVAIDELRVGAGRAVFVGTTPDAPPAVVALDLATGAAEVLRASSPPLLDPAFVSIAEPIVFPVDDGKPGAPQTATAHAYFYRPKHPERTGPPGTRPPLIVMTHGGPTAATDAGFKAGVQYWTTRGFAVVDVDYGGSTGHGRAYRARLDGRWGIVDVADCVAATRFLVERGEVDPARVAIRGGSAGGYTTLCALTFTDVFAAGASHYGIGDLEAIASDTHKFESRYLDRLLGPYPEARDLYRARSPIHHTDRLARPLILLQGAEDAVVPPSQAQAMYDAVAAKGLPVAYLLFEGEQHGFRRAETIRRALEAELYFYGKVFGFEPADRIEAVEIRNLPSGVNP